MSQRQSTELPTQFLFFAQKYISIYLGREGRAEELPADNWRPARAGQHILEEDRESGPGVERLVSIDRRYSPGLKIKFKYLTTETKYNKYQKTSI